MSPCYVRQDDQESLNGERLNHTEIWGRIVAVRGKKMCKDLGVESYLAWSDSNRETCVPGTDCAEGESRPETLHVSRQLNEFMADAREQVEGRSLVWWRWWEVIGAFRAGEWHALILISGGPAAAAAAWGGDCRMAKMATGRTVLWPLWLSSNEGYYGRGETCTIWGLDLKLE